MSDMLICGVGYGLNPVMDMGPFPGVTHTNWMYRKQRKQCATNHITDVLDPYKPFRNVTRFHASHGLLNRDMRHLLYVFESVRLVSCMEMWAS